MPITLHNHLIDKLAVVVGIVSGFALYPQIIVMLNIGTHEGVSITTYGIIFVNSLVWLAYSIHRSLISLAIPSILNIFASATVIIWFITT